MSNAVSHSHRPPDQDDVDGFLAWRLVRVGRQIAALLTEAIAEFGLTPTEFGVLAHLSTGTPLTQSELARTVLVRPQSMGTLIAGLVDKGLVTRHGAGGRGRRTPIALSDAGVELIGRAWPSVAAETCADALGLDADDAAELDRLLRLLPGSTELA